MCCRTLFLTAIAGTAFVLPRAALAEDAGVYGGFEKDTLFSVQGFENLSLAVIDRRPAADTGPAKFDVSVQAKRNDPIRGSAGHTWVSWAKSDETDKRPVVEMSYGFWPEKALSGLAFLYVPGKLARESDDVGKREIHRGVTHTLVFVVDKATYDRTAKRVERFGQQTPFYQLEQQSCKNPSAEVLSDLGVPVNPTAFQYPHEMLESAFKSIPAGPPRLGRGVVYEQGF